jgi:hypothetical protein
MSKTSKPVVAAVAFLIAAIFIAVVHAQRPPDLDPTGAAYLRVNINPTDIPPMVNINPGGAVPAVDVTHLPDVRIAPTGCQNRQNFQTGVARSVSGPLVVTYLHLPPQQTTVSLTNGGDTRSMNFGQAAQITTAIYLQAGQRLDFSSDVMYSGCRPE